VLSRALGGIGAAHTSFYNHLFMSFSLRHLLTQGGFRLPGEAQQIDRIISTFAQCYWEDNAGDPATCPFKHQDTIFLLAFAIIMLNTDLHKNGRAKGIAKKREKNKMTKVEFINNLKGVEKGGEIDSEYLSVVYDQIETSPILIQDSESTADDDRVTTENIQASIKKMVDNAKSVDALLRGLSTHESHFISLRTHASDLKETPEKITKTLARTFVQATWHEFHGLVNVGLEVAHLDPQAMESCMDLLKYSYSLTILLGMPVEQVAFLDQLGRLRLFDAWRTGNDQDLVSKDQESYKNEDWYMRMESNARFPSKNGEVESMVILDSLIRNIDESKGQTTCHKTMRDAARQLENAEFLLNDPTRTFVRQGDMLKKANRSGRCAEYRFFLFSDVLIYAKKQSNSQKLRIHEELPLILMKVVDWFPPEQKKEAQLGIQIYHPRKKFVAFCSSQDERKLWVKDIRKSIEKELERKVAIEGARKAATHVPTSTT
jgi:hypothetical protein